MLVAYKIPIQRYGKSPRETKGVSVVTVRVSRPTLRDDAIGVGIYRPGVYKVFDSGT